MPRLIDCETTSRHQQSLGRVLPQTLSCLTSTHVHSRNPPLVTPYSSQSYDLLSLYIHFSSHLTTSLRYSHITLQLTLPKQAAQYVSCDRLTPSPSYLSSLPHSRFQW